MQRKSKQKSVLQGDMFKPRAQGEGGGAVLNDDAEAEGDDDMDEDVDDVDEEEGDADAGTDGVGMLPASLVPHAVVEASVVAHTPL